MEVTNELIDSIKKSINIPNFESHQVTVIKDIISDLAFYGNKKASLICEYLGLPEKENKDAIASVLSNNGIPRYEIVKPPHNKNEPRPFA